MALPKQDPIKLVEPKGNEWKRLRTARSALLFSNPYFGLLALRLTLVEQPEIRTAGVDGKRFFYNPGYIAGLDDEQVRGLWAHEVLHCSNGHMWRRSSRDPKLWNLACDYAIDPMLINSGIKVPNATVHPDWPSLSAEQIYERLKDEMQNGDGANCGASGSGPQAKDQLLDPQPDEVLTMQAEWKQAVAKAAAAAKSQGKLPSNLELQVDELLAPKVDWRAVLRRFVQQNARNDYSYQRPSARYLALGCYMPRLQSEQMPPIVVGIDTSGSCLSEQQAFASEVTAIIEECKPETAHIVFCDARVQHVQQFEHGDVIRLHPKGGGGTSFIPVFEWVEQEGIEPACLLYLTDTYGSFPDEEPQYPVLWAVTVKDREIPFGEQVYVGDDA